MNDRVYRGICRQFDALSKRLDPKNDVSSAQTILDVCCNLLSGVGKLELSQADRASIKSFSASLLGIVNAAEATVNAIDAPEDRAALQRERDEASKMIAELGTVRGSLESLTRENEQRRRELAEARQKCAAEKAALDSANELLTDLDTRHNRLLGLLKAAESDRDELQRKYNDSKTRHEALLQELRQFSEDQKAQAALVLELEKTLAVLNEGETRYNAEAQQRLQERIAEKQPEVDRLEEEYRALDNLLQMLGQTRAALDDKRHTLETNVLEKVDAVLQQLEPLLHAHQQDLAVVKAKYDGMLRRLSECQATREDYAELLSADKDAIRQVEELLGLGDPLHHDLRDVAAKDVPRLKKLTDAIQANLDELDRLLRPCFAAVGKNRLTIRDLVKKGNSSRG